MLTPAPPIKGDPLYQAKQEQYRKDRHEKQANPEGWGVVPASLPQPDREETPAEKSE
jgi:hypothetical protein